MFDATAFRIHDILLLLFDNDHICNLRHFAYFCFVHLHLHNVLLYDTHTPAAYHRSFTSRLVCHIRSRADCDSKCIVLAIILYT